MIPFKNRPLNTLLLVEVYRNLHGKASRKYSVRQGGVVVAHCKELTLTKCTFVVSEAGRQRVIQQGRKNVHAKVVGYVVSNEPAPESICNLFHVTYNPYKASYFFNRDSEKSVEYAPYVFFRESGVSVASLTVRP